MLLESTAAIPCASTAVGSRRGAQGPSFNIHFVSGATQGAPLVPKTAGVRAVQSLRDEGRQGQGVRAAEEAIWVMYKGMKAGTGSMERFAGTWLPSGWDGFTGSWAEGAGQAEELPWQSWQMVRPPQPAVSCSVQVAVQEGPGLSGGAGCEAHPSGKGRLWRKDKETPRTSPGFSSTLIRNRVKPYLKKAGTEVKPL